MKNYQDRAMRLAHRNGLIQALFFELITHDGLSFTESYVFLETFFGIDERQMNAATPDEFAYEWLLRRIIIPNRNINYYFTLPAYSHLIVSTFFPSIRCSFHSRLYLFKKVVMFCSFSVRRGCKLCLPIT